MTSASESIPRLLADCRTIAVVGLSAKPNRPSYGVAHYMQAHGYRIIPVNPMYAGTHILDEYCYGTLTEAAAALAEKNIRIDMVDCFRKSEMIMPIAEEAIAIGARCLWMQLGVINQAAADKARAAGLATVVDYCLKIEHMQAQ